MNILIIGGTRFIGPFIVRELCASGHTITVFHRGKSNAELPCGVSRITGDRNDLFSFRQVFKELQPDVVIDMILVTNKQAKILVQTIRGISHRVIAISSQDVYRAYGIMLGKESGNIETGVIHEDDALRSVFYPYRGETPRADDDPYKIYDEYDKIPIEHTITTDPDIVGTILRLPMVYGPGDYQHRLFEYIKRMDDGRTKIILDAGLAQWKSSFGYVENVAHAICCSAIKDKAAGRTYNVADPMSLTMKEWIQKIGKSIDWKGAIISLRREHLPKHLLPGFNTDQHLAVSSERIRNELGYTEIVPFEEGLARTVAWERANPPAKIDPAQYEYQSEDRALEQYTS